jgi:hypothetical protein
VKQELIATMATVYPQGGDFTGENTSENTTSVLVASNEASYAPAATTDWHELSTPEGHTYWYNNTTQESTWYLPAELGGSPEEAAAAHQAEKDEHQQMMELQEQEEHQRKMSQQMEKFHQQAAEEETPTAPPRVPPRGSNNMTQITPVVVTTIPTETTEITDTNETTETTEITDTNETTEITDTNETTETTETTETETTETTETETTENATDPNPKIVGKGWSIVLSKSAWGGLKSKTIQRKSGKEQLTAYLARKIKSIPDDEFIEAYTIRQILVKGNVEQHKIDSMLVQLDSKGDGMIQCGDLRAELHDTEIKSDVSQHFSNGRLYM